MVRADVVLNVIEVRTFIFKVNDLGEIIGKLEGIYLRGRKRRRGKELGAVLRDCRVGWTLDRKKRGLGNVPTVPGFFGYFLAGPSALRHPPAGMQWFVVSHSSTIKLWMNGAQGFSVIS
jgi:hypothetical protein